MTYLKATLVGVLVGLLGAALWVAGILFWADTFLAPSTSRSMRVPCCSPRSSASWSDFFGRCEERPARRPTCTSRYVVMIAMPTGRLRKTAVRRARSPSC